MLTYLPGPKHNVYVFRSVWVAAASISLYFYDKLVDLAIEITQTISKACVVPARFLCTLVVYVLQDYVRERTFSGVN